VSPGPATRYVALLRGVNLGRRTMPMADLRRLFTNIGFDGVATYLQSGNAVFATERTDRVGLTDEIEKALLAEFRFEVPTILRTGPEMRSVIDSCPYFVQADADPTKVHFNFLEPMPPTAIWDDIEANRFAPEEMAPGEDVLYMHLPGGMGRAKLPDAVARATPGIKSTTRNWRTVVSLAGMLEVG
jgi:uncharacterized protein (DUF1697 family)